MKETSFLTVSKDSGSRYEITAAATACGKDWNITVRGGTHHHVGAVSVALWNGKTLSVSSTSLPSHKDSLVSEMFAKRISAFSGTQTAVTAGIHIDHASQDEITRLIQNSIDCCELLIHKLQEQMTAKTEKSTSCTGYKKTTL